MRTLKIILLSALSVVANAQDNSKQESPQNVVDTFYVTINAKKVIDELVTLIQREKKTSISKWGIDPTKSSAFLLIVDSDTAWLTSKGFVLWKQESIAEQAVEAPLQLSDEKYNPEIDKFLNQEDERVFTDGFVEFDTIDIHPSRRNRYQLIKNIRILGGHIANVELKLSVPHIKEFMEKNHCTEEAATTFLINSAKSDIESADRKFDDINNFDKEIDYLSPQQRQYYDALKDKFNDLYNQVNPQNDQ